MHRTRRFHRRQTLLSWLAVVLLVLLQVQLLPNFSITENDDVIASTAKQSGLEAKYAQLPLAFEPNRGQVDGAVQYLVHHGQATTYFTGTDTVTSIGGEHITMSLIGANQPSFTGTDELPSKTNYFIGDDRSKWQSDIPNYESIVAQNVYPGIDLKYYGTNLPAGRQGSQLEHDFIVAPGFDPKQISLIFTGQKDLTLDSNGNLILKLSDTDFALRTPVSYQQTDNEGKKTVTSSFELDSSNTVKIALGDYDPTKPLVIDPVLIYSTYLGGGGVDSANNISIDASGNVYVAGQTTSSNFPTTLPFQAANAAGTDVFITKLNPTGSALVYSTYLGGSGTDIAYDIAVDTIGNVYIDGSTDSTNFPTSSAFQGTKGAGADAFVTKFNATGSALTYSTFLGGSGADEGFGIALDSSNNAYISGHTTSTNFPTSSPFQAANAGGDDAFIAKFNAAGSALTYSTYIGGSGTDQSFGITIDVSGNAYFVGQTASTNFPTASPVQLSHGGSIFDAFVVKLNATGSTLIYSTYLGGSGQDNGRDIVLDSSINAYVTGFTTSTNFPTSSPFQPSNGGGGFNDSFVTKLNAAGSALTYSTYLGGSGTDGAFGIALDSSNNAYVTSHSDSTNFPTSSPFQAANAGGFDVTVTKFNAAGSSLLYSTYIGGAGTELNTGVALDLSGDAFVIGSTTSTNFPTASPFQAANAGGTDVFLTQLSEHTVVVSGTINPALTFSIGSTTCNMGVFSASQTQFCTHTISAGSNATNGYVISYIPTTTLTSGVNTITAMASQTASVLASEQFGFNLKANTAAGSFTATDFGADASGGTGTAMTGYELANQFKFDVAGDDIAQTTGASNLTTFTASFIANITAITEAGLYATPVTYNIVASY